MKNLIVIMLLLMSTTVFAQTYELVKPTNEYVVKSGVWNIKIIEWIPKDNPNIRCVIIGGDGGGCYDVKKDENFSR